MTRVFDTADFAPQERRDAYMNAFASTEVPLQVSLAPGAQVSARMDLWELGQGIHLMRTQDTGVRITRSSRHLRVAAPERIALAYARRPARITVGASTRQLRPGDLFVNEQTLPSDYTGYGYGGTQSFVIDYDALGVPIGLARRAVQSIESSPMYELFRGHIHRVCHTLDALPDNESARLWVGSATIDLTRGLLSTFADKQPWARDVMHDTASTRIHCYIDQHLRDRDLTPASIARANHVSLRQLYKVWELNELSLSEYIIANRLSRAREDLRRPTLKDRSILAISQSWGFADPAHFSRRFKAAYGLSPRQWRRHEEQA
jgi:AraC-like DNA-binding protein